MSKKLKIISVIGGILLMGVLTASMLAYNMVQGAAPSGLQATLATSSIRAIGFSSSVNIFGSGQCSSRIIRTQEEGISISLGEIIDGSSNYGISSSTVSVIEGITQAASTTISYDSGIYGCGEWYAVSIIGGETATPTISVFQFN